VIDRTRTSLLRLGPSCLHLPGRRVVARGALSCTEYSVELSLRHVRPEEAAYSLRTDEAPRCPTLAAFQPQAQADLLAVLREAGQPVEAVEAVLHQLVRLPWRAPVAMRELGQSPDLPPWLRSFLLEVPVLFPKRPLREPEPADLAALLKETAQVPGLEWHGKALRRLVDYAAEAKALGPLRQVVDAADFVTRWLSEPVQGGAGEEAAVALLLQHAAAAETGHAVDLAATQGSYNVLCGRLGASAVSGGTLRGSLCAAAYQLRSAPPKTLTDGQARASEVYRQLAELTADMKR
jgi:hypothetical protein